MKCLIARLTVWAGVFLTTLLLGCGSPPETADLIITHARVIDGTGAVYEDATIAITGERIQTITDAETPFNATVTIDAGGKTVLPGLIDTHIHFGVGSAVDEESFTEFLNNGLPANLQEYLSHGVTTIKSTGDIAEPYLKVREQVAAGEIQGPRIFLVGPTLTALGGHPAATVLKDNPWRSAGGSRELTSETDARSIVRQLSQLGVDAIKFVYQGSTDENKPYLWRPGVPVRKMTPLIMRAIIDESHKHQLRVTAHTNHLEDALEVLEAGCDGLEHGVMRTRLQDEKLATLLIGRQASYAPTLSLYQAGRTGSEQDSDRLETAMANLKQLADAGVRIVLGTDTLSRGTPPGSTTLNELELMVRAGLSPEQAIQAATRNAAQHLGKLDELGTLEPGKLADLIIVDGDPLKDISVIHNIEVVIKGGKVVVDHR
ncbi:MAG: amidohydrolase family protein [Acidobacteria bacterium]|nr:amidohydrolase family protein [Acidobacteriota bacterium]